MNFYDRDSRFNSLKFKNYGNKQRALSEISRRLTVGSRKYGEAAQEPANRPLPHWSHLPSTDTAADDHHIYLAFGNGSWGAGKKKVPAPTKRLLTHLRQIARLPPPRANRPARPMVTLIMLDEYLTSQICANCHQRTLEHVPATKGQAHPKIHAVLKCNSCRTVWNRDVMAAKNIRYIFRYMAEHNNRRPPMFCRPQNVMDWLAKEEPAGSSERP
jgi:hypothetical protein